MNIGKSFVQVAIGISGMIIWDVLFIDLLRETSWMKPNLLHQAEITHQSFSQEQGMCRTTVSKHGTNWS